MRKIYEYRPVEALRFDGSMESATEILDELADRYEDKGELTYHARMIPGQSRLLLFKGSRLNGQSQWASPGDWITFGVYQPQVVTASAFLTGWEEITD